MRAVFGLCDFFRLAFSVGTQLIGARLQLNVERDLERQVFRQLHEVQLNFIHAQKMGELITFLSYHVLQSGRLVASVINGMGNLFTVIIYSMFGDRLSPAQPIGDAKPNELPSHQSGTHA